MDEFANLKRLPDFQRIIALIRSQKVSLNMVIQSLSQLDYLYGKEVSETIVSNAASLIALPGIREKRTLAFIQQLLGETTKISLTSSAFAGFTIRKNARQLMTLNEIRTMHESKGLFVFANKQAKIIKPLPIYLNPKLMEQSGLKSENGKLVPITHKPLLATQKEVLDLPTIEEELIAPELQHMKEKLNNIIS